MDPQRVIAQLSDLNPDAVFFDNMDAALVGLGCAGQNEYVAVYSKARLLDALREAGLSADDAEEYYLARFIAEQAGPNAPFILDDVCEG